MSSCRRGERTSLQDNERSERRRAGQANPPGLLPVNAQNVDRAGLEESVILSELAVANVPRVSSPQKGKKRLNKTTNFKEKQIFPNQNMKGYEVSVASRRLVAAPTTHVIRSLICGNSPGTTCGVWYRSCWMLVPLRLLVSESLRRRNADRKHF